MTAGSLLTLHKFEHKKIECTRLLGEGPNQVRDSFSLRYGAGEAVIPAFFGLAARSRSMR